ncbi:hypothetical protein [Azospirillum thermophilum]|uniref:Uncharacterized protein n=1 Tax=Azospirillum thermophilum TaxID=2202148 RepID=A0A2S2CT25_9PROT|nr:hypothetical protein [Azospirillum thermophilum]AWK87652.1 hypothetical protein DEW08_16810 [Azospirillum thermophilum]
MRMPTAIAIIILTAASASYAAERHPLRDSTGKVTSYYTVNRKGIATVYDLKGRKIDTVDMNLPPPDTDLYISPPSLAPSLPPGYGERHYRDTLNTIMGGR